MRKVAFKAIYRLEIQRKSLPGLAERNTTANDEQDGPADRSAWYVIQTLKGKEYRVLEDIRDGAAESEEHVIYHSVGFRVDDMVEITSGSFKGYRGEIRKHDRHNRRAKICIPLMGQGSEVQIGLEIVKNITFAERAN